MPASVSATNRTSDGTGLRIDQAEMLRKFIGSKSSSRARRACALRADLLAGVEEGARRQDDALVAGEARGDGDAAVVDVADPDVAPHDLVLGVDDVDVIALAVALHRASGSSGAVIEPAVIARLAKPPGRIADCRGRGCAHRPAATADR